MDRWTADAGARMTVRLLLAIIAGSTATAAAQAVRGTVVDSTSGKPIAAARVGVYSTALETVADSLGRFAFSNVPAGDRALTIHTPSLDSVNASYTVPILVSGATTAVSLRVPSALQIAATACGTRGYGRGGIVLGGLRLDGDSTARFSGTISAEWATTGAQSTKRISTTADARGRFALCGVPLDTTLTLKAVADGASGQSTGVRVSSAARFARAEVVLRGEIVTTGILAGIVTDSTNRPLGGAEVSVPSLAKTTLTNEEGAFALRDIPAGEQHVVIRRLGYSPVDARLTFQAGRTLQRRISLSRAVMLDSVTVTENAHDAALGDFDDNRRLGLGHFITRDELAKLEGVSTSSVLRSIPGLTMAAHGPYAWVASARAQKMFTSITHQKRNFQSLDRGDLVKGAEPGLCYSAVYLDNVRVYSGRTTANQVGLAPEPLFDINTIPVSEIEAIEYYSSVSQLPAKYLTRGSDCGVLVIHTRRFHSKDTTATPANPAPDPIR